MAKSITTQNWMDVYIEAKTSFIPRIRLVLDSDLTEAHNRAMFSGESTSNNNSYLLAQAIETLSGRRVL